jgi:hypothetical protein
MRCRAIVPIALAILLSGASHARAGDCATLPRPNMRMRLTVASSGVPDAADAIRRIVDAAWRPEGLRFEWLEGTSGFDDWSGIDVWIAAVPGMATPRGGGVLGRVLFGHGVPRRLIRLSIGAATEWIRDDQERRLGTGTSIPYLLGDTARLVPVALGLIAAHEVGHFVLGSAEHSKTGLMQATYTHVRRLLARGEPPGLDSASRAALRRRLQESARCR